LVYQNFSALFPDANTETAAALTFWGNWTDTVPLSSGSDITEDMFFDDVKAEIGNM
jgi:hypothetical protein